MMKKLTSCFAAAAFLLAGFFSCSPSGDLGSEYPKTNVTYTINLDESKKSQPDEGNTSFYQIPAGTAVEIKAEAEGPEKENIAVNWKEEEKKEAVGAAKYIKETLSWKYTPENAAHIEISGNPAKELRVNGEDAITNDDRKFVVEWVHNLTLSMNQPHWELGKFEGEKEGEGKVGLKIDGTTQVLQTKIRINLKIVLYNNTDQDIALATLNFFPTFTFKNRSMSFETKSNQVTGIVKKGKKLSLYLSLKGPFDNGKKGDLTTRNLEPSAYVDKLKKDVRSVKLKLVKKAPAESDEVDCLYGKVTWRK